MGLESMGLFGFLLFIKFFEVFCDGCGVVF